MKKYALTAMTIALALSLAACRMNKPSDNEPGKNTEPTNTTAATSPTILPNPTIETNIPDPSVDTSMPMEDDFTGGTARRYSK